MVTTTSNTDAPARIPPKSDLNRYEQPLSTFPPRLVDLKREIVFEGVDPGSEEGKQRVKNLENAWKEVISALKESTEEIERVGSDIIPQISFSQLSSSTPSISPNLLTTIRHRGAVVIRNVVPVEQATQWRKELEEYVKVNKEGVEGIPVGDEQFFMLYWTRPQVQARAHPNVLKTITWLNSLYRIGDEDSNDNSSSKKDALEGVDLSTPLTYADRFRIRHAGNLWTEHPPHIDGGAIERWEDPNFRSCFASIFNSSSPTSGWQHHDPYALHTRLLAKTSLYGRPNQSSVFRTFQGWLALSRTAPTHGTLKVFPDVRLSNAYLMLRPMFREDEKGEWVFDISTPDFPGLRPLPSGGFGGPRLSPASHPHLRLETAMTSVPEVQPGDMVFWHCDVVHSVEEEHKGNEDSAVMYIPSVPLTPQNLSYLARQKEAFESGIPPPDFPKGRGEKGFVGLGTEGDVVGEVGRRAMGLVF